jgi:hypothetical protein
MHKKNQTKNFNFFRLLLRTMHFFLQARQKRKTQKCSCSLIIFVKLAFSLYRIFSKWHFLSAPSLFFYVPEAQFMVV